MSLSKNVATVVNGDSSTLSSNLQSTLSKNVDVENVVFLKQLNIWKEYNFLMYMTHVWLEEIKFLKKTII